MKTKKAKRVKTGRVTAITISRLYNTGNYTNVKYDLSCQIEKGESAKATMLEMVRILVAIRPITRPDGLDQLARVREKKLSERSAYEKEHYGDWLRIEQEYRNSLAKRNQAVEELDRLGGSCTMKDAKLLWEDYDDTPW